MTRLTYNEERSTKYISIAEGAKEAGISYSRFRKGLQRLRIKVRRHGWAILVPVDAPKRVKDAIESGQIRRGRKKRAE